MHGGNFTECMDHGFVYCYTKVYMNNDHLLNVEDRLGWDLSGCAYLVGVLDLCAVYWVGLL